MQAELKSPCKVNLILNILGKGPDGFHELESVMQPVPIFDLLRFERAPNGIKLTCNHPDLPTDAGNLVFRAAAHFLERTQIDSGVRIHLEKLIPLAAGLGGGSGNAAVTLLGLNGMFGDPLSLPELDSIARTLGSDVPFFLQNKPALATGRGEVVKALDSFPALEGKYIILVHPGFGVSTPWAYKNLAKFPEALNGKQGRAEQLVKSLQDSVQKAAPDIYNSLEAPVLPKYPLLGMFQEFFRSQGVLATLMSGSGSTTFAIVEDLKNAERIIEQFKSKFGTFCWIETVALGG